PAAPLLAVQETQGNALAQELREQALRLAEEGLRQGLAAEQAALEAARASGDAEAIRLHESRVLNMEQGLARVQERAGETEGAAAEMAEGQAFTIVPPPPPPAQPIPEGAVAIAIVFMLSVVLLVLGFPIMRAMGRRGSRAQAVALPDPE